MFQRFRTSNGQVPLRETPCCSWRRGASDSFAHVKTHTSGRKGKDTQKRAQEDRTRVAAVESVGPHETKDEDIPSGLTALLAFASFGAHQVSGHGYLVQPLAKFISVNIDKTQYSSTIDSYKLFPDGTFNTDLTINVKSFVENFKKSEYKSLKDMILDKQVLVSGGPTASCGFSVPDKTSYGALNDTVYWGRNDDITQDQGFVHMGPCEVWCDNNRAQQDNNCQETYNNAGNVGAAPVPIDKSVCTDAKRLTFYWVAMHGATWQVYINCVNINGATGGDDSTSTTPTSATSPSTSNTTPTATTATPTPSSDEQENTNESPEVTTTPVITPAAATTPTTAEGSTANEASTSVAECSRRIRG
ncbi:hypothetical protein V7S43_003924 [Phytophthora oleae]|uniref:Uncharacterized protein n=1 Tax=Phytophthora oleae TaxID=2107226 RepID=A0ABD3FYL3_9STRA